MTSMFVSGCLFQVVAESGLVKLYRAYFCWNMLIHHEADVLHACPS